MLWEYLRNGECWSFQTFAIVFSTPENLLVEISGALEMKESHFLNKMCVWENAVGVSQKWWMLELSNLCHCVQHPWKLTSRVFWSSRNKEKSLSKLKHIFRKCSGVCQKLWKLELSNLFHCVQHPWKLTSRDYWSSRNKGKSLSMLKHIFRKCSGVSQNTVNARDFKHLPLCSAPLKTY